MKLEKLKTRLTQVESAWLNSNRQARRMKPVGGFQEPEEPCESLPLERPAKELGK